jgi:hypothetical protein
VNTILAESIGSKDPLCILNFDKDRTEEGILLNKQKVYLTSALKHFCSEEKKRRG